MCPSFQPTASRRPWRSTSSLRAFAEPRSIGRRVDGRPEGLRKTTRLPEPRNARSPSDKNWTDPTCLPSRFLDTPTSCPERFLSETSQRSRFPKSEAVTRVRESGLKLSEYATDPGAVESGDLSDAKLTDGGHGVGSELGQVAPGGRHDRQPREVLQALVAQPGWCPARRALTSLSIAR